MIIRKKQWINAAFIIGILLILFTPVGFHAKVLIARLFSTNASEMQTRLQKTIESYEWQLVDANGTDFDFTTAMGKVVLLNFWATWCPPCVAEMPSLQALYNAYGSEVVFLFVTNDDPKKVAEFVRKKDYSLPVYFAKTDPPSLLSSKYLPTTYIIDRGGKLKVVQTGASDWNSEQTRKLLDELLRE